jgi:hypothetical protein
MIWRLNGENNQFEFINDTITFAVQHSILEMNNGNFSLFDNSAGKTDTSIFSSAVEYQIDEINMTATLVERLRRYPDAWGKWMANTYRFEDGHTVNGWGFSDTLYNTNWRPGITEFDKNGNMTWDILYNRTSYRAFKHVWQTEAITFGQDSVDFGTILYSDSSAILLTVYNNTSKDMIFNQIVHNNPVFSVITPMPFTISAGNSLDIEVKCVPEHSGHYTDVFTLCSENENGASFQRIARQFHVECIAEGDEGIDLPESDMASIIPNPNQGIFTIIFDSESPRSIRIFKSNGSLIFQRETDYTTTLMVDLTSQPGGIYFIEIYNKKTLQSTTNKLILH